MSRKIFSRFLAALVLSVLAVSLSGCANDPLAEQYRSGSDKNYVAANGTITEIAPRDRGSAVRFAGKLEDGTPISSSEYTGQVLVLNFWYAGCAPCRAEAPDLEKSNQKFTTQGVKFLGVNVRDQAATALAFSRAYAISYPSVLDADDGALQLAFSGTIAPNAVPTTLVVDRQGRVSARILGRIPDASVLNALITTVLAEKGP
jgi:peroxiredoxin